MWRKRKQKTVSSRDHSSHVLRESLSETRKHYVRFVGIVITLIACATFVVGVLLIALYDRIWLGAATQNVALAVGVNLATFGGTTLLITLFASQQLEYKLLGRVNDRMLEHVDSVKAAMDDVEDEFRDTIRKFVPLFGNCNDYGLDNVYLTRADALIDFGEHIKDELREAAASEGDCGGDEQAQPAGSTDTEPINGLPRAGQPTTGTNAGDPGTRVIA